MKLFILFLSSFCFEVSKGNLGKISKSFKSLVDFALFILYFMSNPQFVFTEYLLIDKCWYVTEMFKYFIKPEIVLFLN